MNIELTRSKMIEQQIRTWDVLDQDILDLLLLVRREEFVPDALRGLAFVDTEIPLPVTEAIDPEFMFSPKTEARLLQELNLTGHESALEIGTGSGYMAALLAHRTRSVTSVEIRPELKAFAEANLARAGITHVQLELGDGAAGWPKVGRVDVIAVSGSLPVVPQSLLEQLNIGGRMTVIVGEAPVMTAQRITRTGESSWSRQGLFETQVKALRNAARPSRFKF